jgi:hypothetical protein
MTETCFRLHQWFNALKRFNFQFDKAHIPSNGIYVLFEKGEIAHGLDRVVRVGTHSGSNQLPSRLVQHFLNENKDRSIFRKNIGRCFLNRDNDPFLKKWDLDLTTKAAKKKYLVSVDLQKQKDIEKKVSQYIQSNFSFAVFQLDDEKGRRELESKIISTISLCNEHNPSENWLGKFSPKKKICKSGLWLLNELYKEPLSESDMMELHDIIYNQ